MASFKKILTVNAVKIFRRPLYCAFFILLGLPVHIAVFLVYLIRRKSSGYASLRRHFVLLLRDSGEGKALRAQVERQLQNKYRFLGQTVSANRFRREAASLYEARFAELIDEKIREEGGGEVSLTAARQVRYISTFTGLLDMSAYLVFFCLAGFPMLVMILVYSAPYAKYIFERVVMMVFVIFGVTLLVFTILYMSPLDAARNILGPTAVAEQIESFDKIYGLDQPYHIQLISVQAQILNLMMDLQKELNLTYMFISHDLSVVKHISNHVGVMYLGRLVERAPKNEIFQNPAHPYTKALLEAIPSMTLSGSSEASPRKIILGGEISSPVNVKSGCRFAARCPFAVEDCSVSDSELREISPGHFVACARYGDRELNLC